MERVFRLTSNLLGAREGKGRQVMALRAVAFLCLGLAAGGCVQSTLDVGSDAGMTPRDKNLLANAPSATATIPDRYKRHIVNYPRKETAGTIVVDSDARYLYYVQDGGK